VSPVVADAPTPEIALRAALRDLRAEAERLEQTELARRVGMLDERLRSRRLLVAVVGEHNRGKSTLINSLIGRAWLPVGQSAPALPPVYVDAGAREHVELVYDDGQTAESTRAELLALSTDDAASIGYARVSLESPDLHGMLLVDTPGLNDPDTSRLAQTVYGLLPRADLAMLVLDSAQALGASEHELIERHILHAGLHRVVVVLNRDDELEDQRQRSQVRERVVRLLTPLLGEEPTILPYAARVAVRARERGDPRLLARSGYPELRALLQEMAASRAQIIGDAVVSRARVLAMELRSRLEAPPETPPVEDGQEEARAARIGAAGRSMDAACDEYLLALQGFTLALRDRLPEQTADAETVDMRRFLPFYIQEQFAEFLGQEQGPLATRLRQALAEAGLADEVIPVELGGRALAPGLHPYIPPDFVEDSLLISTFMQVLGLALPSVATTALMALGPVMRWLTRSIRLQDERGALLTAAQAATMEAGAALEGRIAGTFAGILATLQAGSPVPVPLEAMSVDDSGRQAALTRIDAILEALAVVAGGAA